MKIHIVRSGETLLDIAQKYNITLDRLQEMNPGLNTSEILSLGVKVRVPTGKIALGVSKNDKENIEPAPTEGSGYVKYEEYPENNEKTSVAEPLPKQLPKPPSIEDLSNWSEMLDSSSVLDNSPVYENLDTSYEPTYLETPPEPYSHFRHETCMPPVPQPFAPAHYPMLRGWMPMYMPYYLPPMPMSNPDSNPFYSTPAVSGPESNFAVKQQEWKESSSSEG